MHIEGMTLAEFMTLEELDQAQAARRFGVNQSTISRVVKHGRASVDVALQIEEISGGKISAETLSPHVAAIRARPARSRKRSQDQAA